MRKAFFVVVFTFILASLAFAQAQQNRIVITYESFGQQNEIEINLKQLFGGDYNFVVGETKHVEVKINFLTKVATLKANEAGWKGSEKIVFATDPIYLESFTKLESLKEVKVTKEGKVEEVNKSMPYIKISEEQVLNALDKIAKDSFEMMLQGIELKKVEVFVERGEKGVVIDLSDEADINISFAQNPYKPAITMDVAYNTSGLRAPLFSPSNPERMYTAFIFLGAFAIIFLYFRYGFAVSEIVFKRKRVFYTEKVKSERAEVKKKFFDALRGFERKKGLPHEIYKDIANATDTFLKGYYRITVFNQHNVTNSIKKEGGDSRVISQVREYFSRVTLPYSSEKVTARDLREFISVVKKLSKHV